MTEDAEKKRRRMPAFESGGSLFHAEMDPSPDGLFLRVGGVRRVICLSSDRVGIATRRGTIFVSGKGLSLTVFENQTVGISGRIEGVELQYGKH